MEKQKFTAVSPPASLKFKYLLIKINLNTTEKKNDFFHKHIVLLQCTPINRKRNIYYTKTSSVV